MPPRKKKGLKGLIPKLPQQAPKTPRGPRFKLFRGKPPQPQVHRRSGIGSSGKKLVGALGRPRIGQPIYLPAIVAQRSQFLLRLVGYTFLILAIFDYAGILTPPGFREEGWQWKLPEWQWIFSATGQLVEKSVVPMIGIGLIFFRQEGYTKRVEMRVMWFLSWLTLLLGIIYALLVPFSAFAAWKVHTLTGESVAEQVKQAKQQLDQRDQLLQRLNTQIEGASEARLQQYLANLKRQGRAPDISDAKTLRERLLSQTALGEENLKKATQQVENRAEDTQAAFTKNLLKNTVKWTLGALVSGVIFIWIWAITGWARNPLSALQSKAALLDTEGNEYVEAEDDDLQDSGAIALDDSELDDPEYPFEDDSENIALEDPETDHR